MMEKMQPEGGYESIDAANPIYTKMMEKTGVYAIKPDFITLKVKAGQNLSKERQASLMSRLEERGASTDSATIQMMGTLQKQRE
jgi:hypothetical protein